MADDETELEEQSDPQAESREAPPEPPPMESPDDATDEFDENPSTQPHADPVAAADTVSGGSVDTLDDQPTEAGPPPTDSMVDQSQTTVVVYKDGEAVDRQSFVSSQIRFGARTEPGSSELDLGEWDDRDALWTEHGVIYSDGDDRTLVVTSDGHTQLNGELLGLGESRSLEDGDRLIVADDIGLVVNF